MRLLFLVEIEITNNSNSDLVNVGSGGSSSVSTTLFLNVFSKISQIVLQSRFSFPELKELTINNWRTSLFVAFLFLLHSLSRFAAKIQSTTDEAVRSQAVSTHGSNARVSLYIAII